MGENIRPLPAARRLRLMCNTELAQNFKEQGNDYFKGKRYREALGFYTQGVEAKPTDSVLHEAILCNRAACNLELRTCNICFYHIGVLYMRGDSSLFLDQRTMAQC